jgi:hypothetical protein
MTIVNSSISSSAVAGITSFNLHRILRRTVLLQALGVLFGLVLGGMHLLPDSTSAAWMQASSGWELKAFGVFASLSGFSIAALSLVASLSSERRDREALASNAGKDLVQQLVNATFRWFYPAVLALSCIFVESHLLEAAFVLSMCFGVAQGFVVLHALRIFLTPRFRR